MLDFESRQATCGGNHARGRLLAALDRAALAGDDLDHVALGGDDRQIG